MVEQSNKKPALRITADELNCLVYAYLKDSGFTHSAWSLRNEAQLDNSPNAHIPIPRGEIVSLMDKALRYIEVEEAWAKGQEFDPATRERITLLGRFVKPDQPVPTNLGVQQSRPAIIPTPTTVETPPVPVVPSPSPAPNGNNVVEKRVNESIEETRPKKRPRTEDAVTQPTTPAATATASRPSPKSTVKPPETTTPEIKPTVDEPTKAIIPETPAPTKPPTPVPNGISSGGILLPPDGSPSGVTLLKGHRAEVFTSAWNPVDPGLLASGGKNGIVMLWRLVPPSSLNPGGLKSENLAVSHVLLPSNHTTTAPRDMTAISWNHSGTTLAVGHQDASIRLWNASGSLITTLFAHKAPVFDVSFSQDGKYMVSAGLEGVACLWDTSNLVETKLKVKLMDHKSPAKLTLKNPEPCCLDTEWLSEGVFATCGTDCRIFVYDVKASTPLRTLEGHIDEVNQIHLSPDGTNLASCSDDKSAVIWSVSSIMNPKGPVVRVILAGTHKKAISMIQWSPLKTNGQNRHVGMFSREERIATLWDVQMGTCLRVFDEYYETTKISTDIFAHGFDPTGKFYVLGGVRFTIIYDVETGKALWTWPFMDSYAADIQWQRLHDGRRIAICKENRLVAILDAASLGIPQLMLEEDKRDIKHV